MSQLEQFMAAIRQVESGNRYGIVGTDHGSRYGVARGAYQIMSGIWDGWAKEAGLAGADWRDPAAQDAVARHKMSYYYRKYGDWRLVAAAWFGGEGAANEIRDKGTSGRKDGFGTTVPGYIERVISNFDAPIAQGEAQSGFDNVVTPQQSNVAVGDPLVDGVPVSERESNDDMRVRLTGLLDSMSSKIAANPDRFTYLYGPEEGDEQQSPTERPTFDDEQEVE